MMTSLVEKEESSPGTQWQQVLAQLPPLLPLLTLMSIQTQGVPFLHASNLLTFKLLLENGEDWNHQKKTNTSMYPITVWHW